MLTSKQRAKLRSKANTMETIFQVGKSGVTETVVAQVEEAILPREMIKIKVLETAMLTAREVAQDLAEKAELDIVQVIGNKVVLFKRNPKEPIYDID